MTELRESEQLVKLMLDTTSQATFALDLDGTCTLANRAASDILGYEAEALRGHNMHAVMHHSRPDGAPYPVAECSIYEAFRRGDSMHVDDEVFWRADGTSFAAEYHSEPIVRNGTLLGAVVSFSDITERRRAEAEVLVRELQLQHRAETDPLTGVGNRLHANAILDSLGPGDAVVMLDVDHFKAVNDTLGHLAGDKILIALATHLRQQLRGGDSLARYGGEEFLLVLRGATTGATAVVQRISDLWAAQEATTFSAGIAICQNGRSATETLQRADAALYEAKNSGRNRVVQFGWSSPASH